ncbi:hypothetical protein D3C79_699510 [compost metagenome]
MLAGRVTQAQLGAGLGKACEGGGEGLAHRTDLEQGVGVHRLAALRRRYSVVKVVLLAIDADGHGHAGDGLLLHQRAHGGVYRGCQRRIGKALPGDQAKGQGGQNPWLEVGFLVHDRQPFHKWTVVSLAAAGSANLGALRRLHKR